ncbi:MAG: SH3 domain-containing protein [Blastocatellia bacterium]|nr:SH3 domain-containing protein [Blastocatellia bacterium]
MSRGMIAAAPRGRRVRYANWDPYDYPPEYYDVPEPEPVAPPARAQAPAQTGQGNSTIIGLLLIMVLALAGWIAWKTYREGGGAGSSMGPPYSTEAVHWINADNVNLRVQPDERSRVLSTLPRNTRVILLGEYQTEPDGDTWAKVRVETGAIAAQEGWVIYRFLN